MLTCTQKCQELKKAFEVQLYSKNLKNGEIQRRFKKWENKSKENIGTKNTEKDNGSYGLNCVPLLRIHTFDPNPPYIKMQSSLAMNSLKLELEWNEVFRVGLNPPWLLSPKKRRSGYIPACNTEKTPHEDSGRSWQAKERGLRRNQACWLTLGSPTCSLYENYKKMRFSCLFCWCHPV